MPRLSPVQMFRSAELVMGKCQLDSRAVADFAYNSATKWFAWVPFIVYLAAAGVTDKSSFRP